MWLSQHKEQIMTVMRQVKVGHKVINGACHDVRDWESGCETEMWNDLDALYYGDHRVAMAAHQLALECGGYIVGKVDCWKITLSEDGLESGGYVDEEKP